MDATYKPGSQNPFHSWWYVAFHYAAAPLALVGVSPCLVRCKWTKSRSRIGLCFVGW